MQLLIMGQIDQAKASIAQYVFDTVTANQCRRLRGSIIRNRRIFSRRLPCLGIVPLRFSIGVFSAMPGSSFLADARQRVTFWI